MTLTIEKLKAEKARLEELKVATQIAIDAIITLLDLQTKSPPDYESPIQFGLPKKGHKACGVPKIRWGINDVDKLIIGHKHQRTIPELAKELNRSEGAITQKIIILKNNGTLE